ncbi:hypothetical protein T07_10856 [Trichinella nelsoni]|uniref:Uncharacterized protein n=1 Tax=Trichinella nelsoni TaxID=6336 RepID=A0A0V0RNF3_9BILA|nr:hypothetical protein T07_10856 [Trichinella nelsoni]
MACNDIPFTLASLAYFLDRSSPALDIMKKDLQITITSALTAMKNASSKENKENATASQMIPRECSSLCDIKSSTAMIRKCDRDQTDENVTWKSLKMPGRSFSLKRRALCFSRLRIASLRYCDGSGDTADRRRLNG